MADCQECGMWVDPKEPYHPYAACLMMKGCKDGNVVQANLDAVVCYGAQYMSGFEEQASRIRELEAALRKVAELGGHEHMDCADIAIQALGSPPLAAPEPSDAKEGT